MENKGSILVVEDTHESLALLTRLLNEDGYTTFSADSGELALVLLENKLPDLILLDVRMAGIDGFEVCRRVKANRKLNQIPIIFLSAVSELSDRLEGFRIGAVDFIIKPFEKEELLTRVKTHLSLSILNRKLKERNKELLEAKEQAEESEMRFKAISEQAVEGITLTDLNGNYIFVNPAFCKMVGYSNDELLKMNEVEIKLPFDISDQFRQLICKDKSILIVELNSKFFKINKSEFILDIARDVTERRLSEEKLLASEDKFHKAFHSSPVALGITSLANGSFIELNESLSHLLEYSFDEVMGHTTIELNIWSRQADRISYIDALKKDGFIHNKELIIRCKSGKYKTVLMSSEIINIEGNPCMLSTLFDITKIKQIERAKIETQRLSAIGEMSASIAHDFNNSLQAILGNLELATYKSDFPEAKMKLLNTAKTLVVDAASRVQKLQKFGGKTESNSEYLQIDLNNILIDVVNQTKPLWKGEAEKKGITIDLVSKFDDGIEIHGNANELRTAIYNILKNSIEALYKSGQIIIETRKKSEGIFVTITDTGMGMSEATRIKIFEPFFSTKGLELGRGLGMSGVYAVIAEHKGKVYVKESELGVGTTIEILFPVSPKN